MEKIKKFFKNYGFYMAVTVVSIGAVAAIFIIPNPESQNETQNELGATANAEDIIDKNNTAEIDPNIIVNDNNSKNQNIASNVEKAEQEEQEEPVQEASSVSVKEETQTNETKTSKPISAPPKEPEEISESTKSQEKVVQSVSSPTKQESIVIPVSSENVRITDEEIAEEENEMLNFTKGDMFSLPVTGEVIVPYTDEYTSAWFSKGQGHTMRTNGICISAEIGTEVKAVADGVVIEILEDNTEWPTTLNVGAIGKIMVIDHGNGYQSIYGFQGGKPNQSLIGKTVKLGDELGTIGSPKGPFISEESNIYLQMTKDGEVIDPNEFVLP
ncbi:hypothetical protein AN641_05300 [Candidatus Epulonipiscioides gigas]|nr:hypothetical protein AN641_05300 [Epulopiscium sp. SCG-C07WGA-EpuloA2]